MFQSTLLKRTMTLVVVSLLASALLATIAFIVAGRSATISLEADNAIKQDIRYKEVLTSHPEYFESVDFRLFFFDSSYATGHDYYLINEEGDIINSTSLEHRTLSKTDTYNLVPLLNTLQYDDLDGMGYTVENSSNVETLIFVAKIPVTIEGNAFNLYSLSYLNGYNSLVGKYLNILLLSTLMAAAFMLVPAYAFVSRMVLPLQEINEVAMEYGKGNFSIRADESHKGEIGELGQSFNFLADRLSKSINDLTAERNQLQDIFDVISDGIVVVDNNSVPITTNKAIHNLFDRAEKNNMFTERLQLIPFDDVWNDFEECIATGETKTRRIDNRDYAYQCTIIPKYNTTDNSIIGATGFFRDIFEEQKNERFRQDYVANISHELRTPLQTLRGLIEPLSDGMVKKEEDRQRYYQIILNETMRLSRLIDDMLELSKLQSRTLAFKTFPFNLNTLISNIEIRFKPIMKEAGIKFSVQNNYGELPTVVGNPDRVEQILVILLDNAKKYTPKGKTITISTDYIETEKKVYVSVADTGLGIHEYDIGHIFDRFFKADRARGKKGSGLGLSIAKELLTYMGETITVNSKYEEGSTFTFTLTKAEVPDAWD
ncbi:two-component system, OmpR family, sensor histidine kinase ResE [Ruminococcaceae bacterium YAD3003]|nr:two-component system, OmpR family, sensor histidine kinase ResE [Ruminococcaceae bacterium YAD3003]